jgi:hypothetical protein
MEFTVIEMELDPDESREDRMKFAGFCGVVRSGCEAVVR